jgi:hypothetical protein
MTDDDAGDKVVQFPTPDEERARRLNTEVARLALLPTVEWMFYASTETHAAKYGVDCATLKRMVEAVIKQAAKARQAEQTEQRRAEDHAEKQRNRAAQQEQREQKQREDAAAKAAEKAEKRERDKHEAFASIVELPSAMHEARLAELAKRLGEDPGVLEAEFAVFADSADRRRGDVAELWPEPVDTRELLTGVEAQFCRYIVVRAEEALAIALWTLFAWVHDITTHSPLASEKVEHFSYEDDEAFYTLRRKLARWAADNKMMLKPVRPVMPEGFNNRLADNWRIMIAIADLAGGTYPKAARAAAVKLSHQSEPDEGIRLLEAFRELFVTAKQVFSEDAVKRLNADPPASGAIFAGAGVESRNGKSRPC